LRQGSQANGLFRMENTLLAWREGDAAHFGRRPLAMRHNLQRALGNIILKRSRDTDLPFSPGFACPHRVVNADSVNRRGPTEWAKLGLAHKALTGVVQMPRLDMKIDFRVDFAAHDGYVDIEPYRVAR
jgi:hypothetical protein